ncbi:MAG: tight adherence protein C [Pirellulaceae bacterium]|jgi:tight adherence protein C
MNSITEYLQNQWAIWVNSNFSLIPQDNTDRMILWGILGAIVVMIIMLRRTLKKKKEEEEKKRFIDQGDGQEGAFGNLTDALAAQIPESSKETKDFQTLLRQAGLYSRTARGSIYAFRFVLLFFPLMCAGILAVLDPPNTMRYLIFGGIIAGGLSIIPRLYVFFRRSHRVREIRAGLADMMDMLSMCLSGGMALGTSLDHVAQNLMNYPSLAEELRILKRQAEVGSLQLGLRDFAERIDLPQVRQVAGLLARGETLGSQMSNSLLDQADHFRNTRRQMATMHANRTPVVLTLPLMFCFAPAVLILLMAPALFTLTDFLNPREGAGVMDGNETISIQSVSDSMNSLSTGSLLEE